MDWLGDPQDWIEKHSGRPEVAVISYYCRSVMCVFVFVRD